MGKRVSRRNLSRLLYTMRYKLGNWWRNLATNFFPPIGTFAILAVIIFISYYALHPDIAPSWTGFGKYDNPTHDIFIPSKNLWDWLELIFVPATLAFGIFFLNYWQSKNAERLSLNNQRQAILESYFDRMSDLVLTHDLKHENSDKLGSIARTRTFAALRQLDGGRKAQLLQFLQELQLIRVDQPLLNLSGADFSDSLLAGADLRDAKLNGTSFKRANLQYANIIGADLTGARFDGSNLVNCDFTNAILTAVNFEGANLKGAIFDDTVLKDVNFRYSNASETLIAKAKRNVIDEDNQSV